MLLNGLTNLPRQQIRTVLVVSDVVVAAVAAFLALGLAHSFDGILTEKAHGQLGLAIVLLTPLISIKFRLHKIKLSLLNAKDAMVIVQASLFLAASFLAAQMVLGLPRVIASTAVFASVLFTGVLGSRVFAIALLGHLRDKLRAREPVAIFGAGAQGIHIATAILQAGEERPVIFFDDSPHLHGMALGGIDVLSPKTMLKDLERLQIRRLVIALPETAHERQQALVALCDRADIDVRVVPTFVEMFGEHGAKGAIKAVRPIDILGREKVDLDTPEIARSYAGRVVMVTGAGGSIGSELCRQLLNCGPSKIVLFERNEFNLYTIERDLSEKTSTSRVDIVSRLGSVVDKARVSSVIAQEGVDIILHAAAYKHVPLVEENELEGARNNVIGTRVLAKAAVDAKIERFIFVSTDKAVRPTSIMGATKRLAELVVQDIQTRAPDTRFSMVRFGNVLGSSGSVLPLFQKQIDMGGPVTVTHPDVTRFFMTVTEASRLVLLAGAYSDRGEVFVLDMGKPQNILEIAKRMIELSGLSVKKMPDGAGDIEIQVTGLRPGEKLYEELLIDDANMRPTPHPKILRAEEEQLSQIEVAGLLREIEEALTASNARMLRDVVEKWVSGYHRPSAVVAEA